ncbi:gliding motility protein GldN [Aquirufa aurantiipilula]|uniref:Gliding motility protein GldN n=1 Tax=Aquirufa aurantiipilula TaxID=2696561 RepID=A0ABT6BGY8_9BACT|nr:gliding motility protein GldN [Aquirufa aurantiipilula]MDF5689411.1 gliding motility protein GldN [Aquirufa aurantiipilula]
MKSVNQFLLFVSLICGFSAMAQEKPVDESKLNSVRPIDPANIHYKARLWRRMDLNEKINQPFFSVNNEISKFLVEWVEAGILVPYVNDSLVTKLTPAQFKEKLRMDDSIGDGSLSEAEKAAGFGAEGGDKKTAVDDGWGTTTKPAADAKKADDFDTKPVANLDSYFFPKELSIIEIKEDAIIDRQRSRLYFDIQALTLIIPASKTKAGFDKPVASFRYKDVYKLFRSNPNCIWYNAENETQHKNMADAFDLRMFQARIIKKGNAENKFLTDIYSSDREGLLMSQQLEYKLLEMEHDMWEN